MSTQYFNKQKKVGRWFEGLVRPVLVEMGHEVRDLEKASYSRKKGADFMFLPKKNGEYVRTASGQVICWDVECKYDKESQRSGNVYVDLDSLSKTTSEVWIFGLPRGNEIDCYFASLRELAPYAQNWPTRLAGGEYHLKNPVIPKTTFLGLPLVKHLKTIKTN